MYNERLGKLPLLQVAPVWARLKRLDAVGEYVFLINPAALSITKTTAISTMTALGASKPNILPQTQTTAFSLPLLLTSPGCNLDMSDDIALITTLSTLKPDQSLPKLSFTFGSFIEPLCVISAFSYSIAQWREGKPTVVTGSITITPYAEVSKPELFKEDVIKKPAIALSAREQEKLAEVMKGYSKDYDDVRLNGENIEGISKKTKKRVVLTTLKNTIRI